jgi:hypothetical protein
VATANRIVGVAGFRGASRTDLVFACSPALAGRGLGSGTARAAWAASAQRRAPATRRAVKSRVGDRSIKAPSPAVVRPARVRYEIDMVDEQLRFRGQSINPDRGKMGAARLNDFAALLIGTSNPPH